jgi:hypothetical protein
MKNAVQGSSILEATRIAGPQTRSENRLIMPASALVHTRKDREHAEAAGDMSYAGQVGPANAMSKPGWHQLSSLLHIHKM